MKDLILNIMLVLFFVYLAFLSGEFYFFSLPFIIVQMVALLFIFWAVVAKRVYKPEHKTEVGRKKKIFWLNEGPYEFIRHPIYAGTLLFTLAYVQEYLTIIRGIFFILFVLIILAKMRGDEKLNDLHFKHDYQEYKKKTKMLIPYLY